MDTSLTFRTWFAFIVIVGLTTTGSWSVHAANTLEGCPPCAGRPGSTAENPCPAVELPSGQMCDAAITWVDVRDNATGDSRRIYLFAVPDMSILSCRADFNGDSTVNLRDLMTVRQFFLKTCAVDDNQCRRVDLNDDGTVNLRDLVKFRTVFLKNCGEE